MAPIGCGLLKLCLECVNEHCQYVIFSSKPALCVGDDFKIVDLFAKMINLQESCPGFVTSTMIPMSLPAQKPAGFGTMEMIGIGIGAATIGVGLGFALRSISGFLDRRIRDYFRQVQAVESSLTVATVVDDVPGIPTVDFDEFMLKHEERPRSSCYPTKYDHGVRVLTVANPLYQSRSSSEVTLFNRVEKKER